MVDPTTLGDAIRESAGRMVKQQEAIRDASRRIAQERAESEREDQGESGGEDTQT